ncbi:DUF2256 domain-containing protein [Alphaproteobacteria bacterium]|nr:DUF2256 domain-containing protein [Alphaproteobacteria bacterium]MDC3286189.1 DUF2256 domain-containing protein [Alphaproteobacteria bacterium]
MAKMRKKQDLPSKTCPVCVKPFLWRKKWAKDWDNVRYCSERCRRAGTPPNPQSSSEA